MPFRGRFSDQMRAQSLRHFDLRYHVDHIQVHDGGVSANIAYSMAMLGGQPTLFSTVGEDFAPYRARLEALGVNCSAVVVDEKHQTARFFASTDDNNSQLGFFYAGAMSKAADIAIVDVIRTPPDLVVISPNAPAAMARQIAECHAQDWRYIFDPSQQVARLDATVLREGIAGAYALACNDYEWTIIQKQTGYTQSDLADMGVIFIHTLGADGALIQTADETLHIPAYPPHHIANPTGAGDAFRGGLLRGLSLSLPWYISGRLGALCGTYALEHVGTQEHQVSPEVFVARLLAIDPTAQAARALLA
ncbi:MAG: PfkB family carbohydrate kinase [Anaerolineales bacterium]